MACRTKMYPGKIGTCTTRGLPSRLAHTAISGKKGLNDLAASCSTTRRSQLLRVQTAYHSSPGKASPPLVCGRRSANQLMCRCVPFELLAQSRELGDLSLRGHGVSGAVNAAEVRLRRVR